MLIQFHCTYQSFLALAYLVKFSLVNCVHFEVKHKLENIWIWVDESDSESGLDGGSVSLDHGKEMDNDQ